GLRHVRGRVRGPRRPAANPDARGLRGLSPASGFPGGRRAHPLHLQRRAELRQARLMATTEDYRRREESVTLTTEPAGEGETHELLTLNIGPHHPATHGVLRLLATLEGEVVRDVKPIVGYVHTGIEKTAEDKAYWKVIPVVERMDYLAYYFNAMAFCGAVETLLGIEVPPRAQYLRIIHLELNRSEERRVGKECRSRWSLSH